MPSWLIKSALQQIIGRLPKSEWWNEQFQKYITKGYYPSRESFGSKLGLCRQHLDHFLKFNPAAESGFKTLELGTGAWPIVPLGLYLYGALEIWTYDLFPVLNRDMLRSTLEFFQEFNGTGELQQTLKSVQPRRLRQLEDLLGEVEKESPDYLLKRLNIRVRIGDARTTALPDQSIDFIFSTVVLEMIDAKTLKGLLAEFRRLASPHTVMSHYVGLGDQYASFDKSITPYNFLKYSKRQWRLLNNPVIPHSRLRLPDYRDLFKQTGWEIVEERNTSGSLADFNKVRLAPEFRKYAVEDLLVLNSCLVARPS